MQKAIDKATTAAAEGGTGSAALDGAVQTAQAVAGNLNSSSEELTEALENLTLATLTYYVNNPTDAAPDVKTDTRYARGATVPSGVAPSKA